MCSVNFYGQFSRGIGGVEKHPSGFDSTFQISAFCVHIVGHQHFFLSISILVLPPPYLKTPFDGDTSPLTQDSSFLDDTIILHLAELTPSRGVDD